MEEQIVENPVELRVNNLTGVGTAGNLRIPANRQIIGFMKTRPVILGRNILIFLNFYLFNIGCIFAI